MATFNINSSNGEVIANALASGGLSNFQLSPNSSGSGFTLLTDSGMSDYAESILLQNGIQYTGAGGSSVTGLPDNQIVDDYGVVHSSGASTQASPTEVATINAVENPVSNFFSKFGADAISIVVGLIITAAAVWNVVKGSS